jgi:hypothetical protein
MNLNFFKSESNLAFPRCEHRSPSGRQCSQPVCTTDPQFCGTHKPTSEQLTIAELTEAAGTLSSPGEIHTFLTAVTLNRIRGRITPKEASVYSYLCQNLLRSLREIDHFRQLESERKDRTCIPENFGWSLPRPDRSDPPELAAQIPEPSIVNSTAAATPVPSPEIANSTLSESIPPTPAATTASPSKSFTSSTSLTSKIATPPFDPSHFYPLDPTLPRGSQDHSRNIPPLDEAECRRLAARRGLLFNRRPAPSGTLR